jgi:hypothetical protein
MRKITYTCTKENCSFSFKTLDELEMHVVVDRHSKQKQIARDFLINCVETGQDGLPRLTRREEL